MSILSICLLSTWFGCSSETNSPAPQSIFEKPEYIALLTAVDQRNVDAVIPYLSSNDWELRLFASQQCASLKDSALYPSLVSALSDTLMIRKAAAFALGQQEDTTLFEALNARYLVENDFNVQGALLQAMAKNLPLMRHADFANLIAAAPCESKPLWAAFRAMQSGAKNLTFIDKAISDLHCDIVDARLAAAYYLSRTPGIDLTQSFHTLVKAYDDENNIEVKIALAGTFKKSNHPETASWVISELLSTSSDERIAANLLRAAQQQKWLTPPSLMALCADPRPHIASMAASSIANIELPADSLHSLAKSKNTSVAFGAAVKLPQEPGHLAQMIQELPDQYQQVVGIRSLANTNAERDFLESLLTSQHATLRTAALETLLTYRNPDVKKHLLIASELQEDGQLAILGTYFAEHPEQVNAEIRHLLQQAAEACALPRTVETYNALISGLNASSDSTQDLYVFKGENVPDYKTLANFNDTISVTIHTSKGIIAVDLYPLIAPGTVAAFLKLADSGFYDQKRFHRVVPNFVIQGGCPRGDGWGSSDDVIRSEFSAESYSTGALGMASAGKDTESCQWFITHSPTPHLDGRYTLFGRVSSGMEVVRQITEGDTIEKILY